MSTIDDIPTRPNQGDDFGQGFNYNVWTPNTRVELCRVPWNNDYRDIVKFDSQAKLDAYLDSSAARPFPVGRMTYARVGDPIRLDIPFNVAYQYNYIRVTNPPQPIHSVSGAPDINRSFYYFIADVKYINPQCTEIQVQLDVWQTFGFDISFGNCYIERGHIGIANENVMANQGLDFLTVPEGFDLGSDYMPRLQWIHDIMYRPDDLASSQAYQPYVLVVSTTSLIGSYGTENNPKLNTASGNTAESLPNGAEQWLFKSLNDFEEFVGYMSSYPWISQGIVSITLVPRFDLDTSHPFYPNNDTSTAPMYLLDSFIGNPDPTTHYAYPEVISMPGSDGWRDVVMKDAIPVRYKNLKKFLTSPYVMLELTTYHGQPIILKPELMPDNDIEIWSTLHLAQPNPQMTFIPANYGILKSDGRYGHDFFQAGGEFWDFQTSISNFPQFSLVNNSYIEFMASNAHRIAYSYQSAAWSEQRALRGNDVAYNQMSMALQNMSQQNEIAVNAATQQANLRNQTTAFNAGIGAAKSAIGDAMSGNIPGMFLDPLASMAGAAVDINQTNQSTAISNTASTESMMANRGVQQYNRDTNKQYADYAARGDYANEIAGINARVQDSKLLQPTTSGQVGGEVSLLVAYGWKLHAKLKVINTNSMRNIGEFWLRYGYAVNRFATPPQNLKCMENFTYWKMKETYIVGWKCPETFKQSIRGIFEKGVTVWTNPGDIGTIDFANNEPLKGIAL